MTLLAFQRREPRREFPGRNIDTMQQLLAAGYMPMSLANVMDDRRHHSTAIRHYAHANSYNTGDMVFRKPDGEVKLWRVPQDPSDARPILRILNPKAPRSNGALLFAGPDMELYEGIVGPDTMTLTQGEVKLYTRKSLTEEQARQHPVWQFFSRTQERLDQYVLSAYQEGKHRLGYDSMMYVTFGRPSAKGIRGHTCFVGHMTHGSDLRGEFHVDTRYTRFVGIAPGANHHKSK